MKKNVNGYVSEMTEEEIKLLYVGLPQIPYKDRVINRLRAVYSVDDELAILRQRDTKPEEYREYNDFVERVKAEEKER